MGYDGVWLIWVLEGWESVEGKGMGRGGAEGWGGVY